MVFMTTEAVGHTVIADIHHDIEIVPSDGFPDNTFGLAGAKAGNIRT